jgi:hypothetical protein
MPKIAKDRPAKGDIPDIPLKKLRQLWTTQRATEEIAILLKVSLPYLQAFARRHNLPKREHVNRQPRKNGVAEVDPTPEEIVARAAECRARWTDNEYARNGGCRHKRVELRSYSFDSRSFCFSEMAQDA